MKTYWFYEPEVGPDGPKLGPKITFAYCFQRSLYERFVFVAFVVTVVVVVEYHEWTICVHTSHWNIRVKWSLKLALRLFLQVWTSDFYIFLHKVGNHWVKVLKNGPSKICRRQRLKNLRWYGLLSIPLENVRKYMVF